MIYSVKLRENASLSSDFGSFLNLVSKIIKMQNNRVNIKEVLSTFDKAMNTLEESFKPELLTQDEQKSVNIELNEAIRLGLKVKLQYQQRKIANLIKSLDENTEIDLVKIQVISNELDKVLKMNEAA